MTDKVRKDLARIIETQRQLRDAELLASKPGGFKSLGSMGKSYKIGKWIDPRLFFKGDI